MHAYLKNYIEKDTSKHELKVNNYFVDIYNDEGIFEIQTKQLFRLKRKLAFLLKSHKVTVVLPIIQTKSLYWLDPESLEKKSKGRKSPRRGNYYDIFKELYGIKDLLKDEGLAIRIILLEVDEYRLLNGWSHDKKKGSVCHDRIITNVIEDRIFDKEKNYTSILPDNLPEEFSTKDLSKIAKINLKTAQVTLNIMKSLNLVEGISKKGNLIIYKRV